MSVKLRLEIPDDLMEWLADKVRNKGVSASEFILAELRATMKTEKEMRGFTEAEWQDILENEAIRTATTIRSK